MAQPTNDGTAHVPELSRGPLLLCLDRSTAAEVCVPHAVALAKTFGCELTLVHVLAPPQEPSPASGSDAVTWEITRLEASRYLDRLATEIGGRLGRPVRVRLEQGQPAERIVDLAREVGASLTMIGSCGKGVSAGRGLGSVARQLLALGGGSVFVAHATTGAVSEAKPTRLLLPLDGSLRSESVLPVAARIAAENGAEVLLLHVVQEPTLTCLLEPPQTMVLARTLAAQLEGNAERYLARLRGQLGTQLPAVRALVTRTANPYRTILDISRTERSDLVVLSAHGDAGDGERSFGNVTSYLLTHGRIPLLVLQDAAPRALPPGASATPPVTRPAVVSPASP